MSVSNSSAESPRFSRRGGFVRGILVGILAGLLVANVFTLLLPHRDSANISYAALTALRVELGYAEATIFIVLFVVEVAQIIRRRGSNSR